MFTENTANPSISELEACLELQKCPRTLANWRQRGIAPPHFKNGKQTRYLLKDIEAFEMPPKRTRGKAKPKLVNHEPVL
jgi:hypothetical protein